MDTATRQRGRLFERPEVPRPMRLTARDLKLLANLADLRLASGEQLAALDGGSAQNVSRALLALWENGYVDRLLGQMQTRLLYKGSFPLIYGLTRPGAWLLRKHGYEVRRRLLYETDKQRTAGWRFIEHRVDISEFMVQLALACRGRGGIELVERAQLFPSAEKTQRDRRIRLRAKARIDGDYKRLSVDPDEMFGLRYGNSQKESFFFLERDRAQMPVKRLKNTDQTYYQKKMLTYFAAHIAGEHERELGLPNFRVLTVTTSKERVAQMIEAQREITGGRGSNLFLFLDDTSLRDSNPIDANWLSGKGTEVKLAA